MSYPLTFTATLVLIGAVIAALRWAATFDDKRWAARRQDLCDCTPYTPPANSRPGDFDEWDRIVG